MTADSSARAILEAETGSVGVVLMDIGLGAGWDGIETAQVIQHVQPLSSFIFVTAYGDAADRCRARESNIRVGGWLEKPIKISEVVPIIAKELRKLSARRELMAFCSRENAVRCTGCISRRGLFSLAGDLAGAGCGIGTTSI